MNHRTMVKILIAMIVSLSLSVSMAFAEEMNWLDHFKFIGSQNVKVSHGSPDYPGSIVVDIIADDEVVEVGEIIKRIKVRENAAISSIVVCFRDYESTLPFGVSIYSLGLPTEEMTVEEDLLYVASDWIVPEEECTIIPFDEAIEPEDKKLLLGIVFNLEGFEDTTAAIVSAVGLGLTSTMLEIDGCDTGVADIDVDGRPLSELIDECAANAKNHGKFVSCVNKIANALKKEGIISGKEKGQISKCAAKSDLP